MRPPSFIYKKQVANLVGDSMFLAGVHRDIAKGQAVKQGMEGTFGALLMTTLENMERDLYGKITDVPAWVMWKQIQYRSELSAVQHLKGALLAYVENAESLFEQMEREEEYE